MPTSTVIRNLESETILRVSWRLLPFLIAAYLINYIDRVIVGFAALQMNKAVGIDPKTYGLGAGIFFLGCLSRSAEQPGSAAVLARAS